MSLDDTMKEVLQLRLTCLNCSSVTVIAIMPWPKRASSKEGALACSNCGQSKYGAVLFATLVPK
jgi:transcription elongation factor Elf1